MCYSQVHNLSIIFWGKTSALPFRDSISGILRNRLESEYLPEWDLFFNSLPKSNDMEHASYAYSLRLLAERLGGEIRPPPVVFTRYRTASDFIDPVTFDGGPISKLERKQILVRMGLYDETVTKRRPRTATDTTTTKKKGAKSTVKQTKSRAKSTKGQDNFYMSALCL